MGLFDKIFDFNGDGKTTSDEKFIAYQIYEEYLGEDRYKWRLYCEDGLEYGVNPNDYETANEYEEALEEAIEESRNSWKDNYSYDIENDIDPDDYDTEEEYLEALEEG